MLTAGLLKLYGAATELGSYFCNLNGVNENVYFHPTEIGLQHLLAVGGHSVWPFCACLHWEVCWGGVNTHRC